MRNLFIAVLVTLLLFSCNENKTNETVENEETEIETVDKNYPENIANILEAHGGLDKWNEMKTLAFTMPSDDGNQVITTDLHNRRSLIETEKYKIGFDGNEAWVAQDSAYFNNDPTFYYDLMFYFYAMPFVLADDGINYSDVEPLNFEGNTYPGIKISYNSGVGASPEDEYILYYNADNNQMEWLSYTVTYFSKEKSDKFSYIKYDQWQDIDGVKLPKVLQWYNVENDSLTTMRNERSFTSVKLTKDEMPEDMFTKPTD